MFSCEYCEIFKNTFFYRTPPVAASETLSMNVRGGSRTAATSKMERFVIIVNSLVIPEAAIYSEPEKQLFRIFKNKVCPKV